MKSSPKRLALFGGTFDPIHNGHLDLALLARNECGLDELLFLPCARSPLKSSAPVASDEQRCQMVSLALAERGWENWASLSRFEIDRPPPSYSWRTADHFRQIDPKSTLYWIVGGDQWEQIERWAEPERLRRTLRFIVVTRRGSRAHPRPGWEATFLEFEHPASATAIREGCGKLDWLPQPVSKFIEAEKLYHQRGGEMVK